MKISPVTLVLILLSILTVAFSSLFRVETLVSGVISVFLFWIIYVIGKLCFRKKTLLNLYLIPLLSLIFVFLITGIIGKYLGISLMPTGLIQITKIRTINQIEYLLSTCQVKGYVSAHSNSYPIYLKDNTTVYLPKIFETNNKNLSSLEKIYSDKCGSILWGIE